MFNLQNIRLSFARHIPILRQGQINTLRQHTVSSLSTSHPLKQFRSLKMDPSIQRRSLNTNPTRPDLGFYTYSNNAHRSQWTNVASRLSSRRHYNSGSSHYPGHGGFSVNSAYWLLFSINAASFATWWYARLTNNGKLAQTHLNQTLASLAAWESGRWWTILTSACTHHDLMHFAFNMLTLKTFCSIVGFVPGIGGGHILLLALGSALAGSGGWVWQQKLRLDTIRSSSSSRGWGQSQTYNSAASRIYSASALGASGVVMGVGAVATCLIPTMPIQLMFIPIGIPLWVVTGLYAVADSYFLTSQTSGTAHAGHLGGLLFGVAYYAVMLRNKPVGIWRILTSRFGGRRR